MLPPFACVLPMPAVHVILVRPADYPAAEGLRGAADSLVTALRRAGRPAAVSVNAFVHDAVNIVVGAHLLAPEVAATLPARTIVFNSEPLDAPEHATTLAPFVARFPVWDYDQRNLVRLRALGNRLAVVVAPGYLPEFVRIVPSPHADIDVLFYGQMSPHRNAVLKALERTGCRVEWLRHVYGAERDAWIARSRLVLNLHYRPRAPLEIGRIVYLLCNRCAVVTEADRPEDVDADLAPGLAMAPAGEIPALVRRLLADEPARQALAARGLAAIRGRDFTHNVQRGLAACGFA